MVPAELTAACASAGLNPAEAQAIIDGTNTTHHAAPALLHAYQDTDLPALTHPSTPAAYDLGLRIRATQHEGVTERASSTPTIRHDPNARVALTRIDNRWALTGHHEGRAITCPGFAQHLIACLATFQTVPALAVIRDLDLHELVHAAAMCPPSDSRDRALGVLHTWRNALEHAAVGYAVNVLDLARQRYATGNPGREDKLVHWASLLGFDAPDPHVATLALWDHLNRDAISVGGPTTTDRAYRDAWATITPQASATENGPTMARNLASRQAWAQWHEAYRCADLLASRAELWTGQVACGVLRARRRGEWEVTGTMAFHHPPGSEVSLTIGNQVHAVTITGTSVAGDRTMTIALAAPGRTRAVAAIDTALSAQGSPGPSPTALRAWLGPLVPDLAGVIATGAVAADRRRKADAKSWLGDPSRKTPTRDVPWDVMFAAST